MNLLTEKKEYIKPITESFPMILEDIITNSPEYYKEYIDGDNDDWGDNVIIDPDDEIDW